MTISNTVFMRLGKFGFSLSTLSYSELQRRTSARFARNERYGTNSSLQYVGFEDVITLKGELLPHWKGGYEQLPEMRRMLKAGTPLLMVDGRGFVHGKWAITEVSSTEKEYFAKGVPVAIDFQISLEYCEI